jgi:glycosidase
MPTDLALREFHVSRDARDTYQFDESLFTLKGNVIFVNFHGARTFAKKINAKRDLVNFPERAVRAGHLNAMGLIDEILHYLIGQYREQRNPDVLAEALEALEQAVGEAAVERTLRAFVDAFPPISVYRREQSVAAYLEGTTDGIPNRHLALEEMLMLWLENDNPAFAPFMDLFDDADLEKTTAYTEVFERLETFFEDQPRFGPEDQTLIDLLRSPARAAPHSLEGQLDYIRTRWASMLGKYLYRLLSSLDFLAEEEKAFFGFGPGPVEPYEFEGMELEPERFSPDSDWMPRLVLIAKNVYVWLDQLSKEYGREIRRLDQVPNEALDRLARWGFTGLWFIGLWERSDASKRIKQIMGNPEAVASAYSLRGYWIAEELGGEAAFEDLKARAWERGIRMASDMVPNHTGIDSRWLIEHPDWFIGLDYPPFPTYEFTGPDLCDDDRVGVYIEDHYYTRSDAAVVFKRRDHWTGSTRYIYHGNDGTSMPWNDTAQLNYLMAEVREAVIQTILDVARRSPIIRFDAAMTLTKRHYQRLWFPEPGGGGDIPSRAGFGMTKEQFDAAMPQEFWREVVDRVAEEVPDTLLLAEAFWLMEGYFVRTLGMHRVYNSAFMNMMRDEKNAQYRQLIKNTLEFDPQILKRYVNFMNNPDERTAVDQFGKGDKYFGICTMMVTMPGLPMFGHGQVEGYAEKYGMEFRRSYWDENPDPYLVERHERQIFPLLHQRDRFAEVDAFLLYDVFTPAGSVDENVFAYSNRSGGSRSLVVYHNRYAETRGWVRTSVAYAVKDGEGEKHMEQRSLAEGLQVPDAPDVYLIFRDVIADLEYIRNCKELADQGLYVELHAYQAYVFLDFREVPENEWGQYGQLTAYLDGRGVPSIEEAMRELLLEPIYAPFRMLVSGPAFRWLLGGRALADDDVADDAVTDDVLQQATRKLRDLLQAIAHVTDQDRGLDPVVRAIRARLRTVLALPALLDQHRPAEATGDYAAAVAYVQEGLEPEAPAAWGTLLSWALTHRLGAVVDPDEALEISRSWIDEWMLGKIIAGAIEDLGATEDAAQRALATLKLMLGHPRWFATEAIAQARPYAVVHAALRDPEVQHYLGVNRYQDALWFNKEAFEQWVWWVMVLATVELLATDGEDVAEDIVAVYRLVQRLLAAQEASGYQVTKLLDAAQDAGQDAGQNAEQDVEQDVS